MACFTCGKGLDLDVHKTLAFYKKLFDEKGIERYFYKLSETGSIKTVKKSNFNRIFTTQIQPNLVNGAEYGHISEYNPKP